MGVGAQKDLGGHQTFDRKMTLNFARKAIGFSVQIKVTFKKKKKKIFTEIETVFLPELRWPPKKGLHWNWDGFSAQMEVTSKKKDLH